MLKNYFGLWEPGKGGCLNTADVWDQLCTLITSKTGDNLYSFRNAPERTRSWLSGSRIEIDFRSPEVSDDHTIEKLSTLTSLTIFVQLWGAGLTIVRENDPPIVRERERTTTTNKKTNYFTLFFDAYELPLQCSGCLNTGRLGARSTSKCPILEGNFRFQTTKQISDHHRSQITMQLGWKYQKCFGLKYNYNMTQLKLLASFLSN